MTIIQNSGLTVSANVEQGIEALRVATVPRGVGFGVMATSGTIAAALAANSSLFAMRLDPSSSRNAFIDRIRLEFVCIAAYTVPITAGRRLALFRGTSTGNATGGTALSPVAKHMTADTSEFLTANGGDVRIATTGALTITPYTYETQALREFSLVHVGTAGAFREEVWEFNSSQQIQLDAGQVLAVRNPLVMDAGGTWQLSVGVDWHEAPAMDYV